MKFTTKISLVFLTVLLFVGTLYSILNSNTPERQKSSFSENRQVIYGEAKYVEGKHVNVSQIQKYVQNQWALQNIEMMNALKTSFQQKKAKAIKVAVIDTGIHIKHPCFINQHWINKLEIPDNNIDDDQNGFIDDIHGWNFVDNNNNIQDYHGHGSHISGIIAAEGPECEIRGVVPDVQIMTLKYFDSNTTSTDNITNTVKAIRYAVLMGADIINYSGGGPGANPDEKAEIAKAADKGIIFVAALGNDGSKIGSKMKYYPASYNLANIIAVQSHNPQDKRVESSNYIKKNILPGKKQTQSAPGAKIKSALPPEFFLQGKLKSTFRRTVAFAAPIKQDHYGFMTGTSQATAFASAVVAFAKINQPNWTMDTIIQVVIQSNKLSALKAVTMRPQNVDLSDQIDNTGARVPYDPDKIDDILRNPKKRNTDEALENSNDIFKQFKKLGHVLENQN